MLKKIKIVSRGRKIQPKRRTWDRNTPHVTDIHCHASGIWSGDDALQVHFEYFEADSLCADISWVVKNEVAVTSDSGLILFFFL